MLTLAIIIGSIVGGVTVITVSALSFTKWYFQKVEGYGDPKPGPKTRFDKLPQFPGTERQQCPLCSCTRKPASMLNGFWFLQRVLDDKNPSATIQNQARKDKAVGPTSGYAIEMCDGQRLYQGCSRCLGEWLNNPFESEEKEPLDGSA